MTCACRVIAEAGVNHNGSIELALELVRAAQAAGADVVKFQTFRAETIVTATAQKAKYQARTTGAAGSQFEMLRQLELPPSAFHEIAQYCRDLGIEFMSSPFDIDSAHFLAKLGVRAMKVASGELTNLPLLRALAEFDLPLIVSTGMATLSEVEAAVEVLEAAGLTLEKISLLHCSSEYPAPYDEVNLRAIRTLAYAFPGTTIGYSDHTEGIAIPIAATAFGAKILEKHLTLDRQMAGPDHQASLSPLEFAMMVSGIRAVSGALGNGRKKPSANEIANRTPARKSIVASTSIRRGELFSESNITTRRPGNGISPMYWDVVIGSEASQDYEAGDLLNIAPKLLRPDK